MVVSETLFSIVLSSCLFVLFFDCGERLQFSLGLIAGPIAWHQSLNGRDRLKLLENCGLNLQNILHGCGLSLSAAKKVLRQ
jgi:hypothetical protein